MEKLKRAIEIVNNRYSRGLNDDDQVARMCKLDKKTKGYSFMPMWDTYELITDLEKLKAFIKKYGLESKEHKSFNQDLISKGGQVYLDELTLNI